MKVMKFKNKKKNIKLPYLLSEKEFEKFVALNKRKEKVLSALEEDFKKLKEKTQVFHDRYWKELEDIVGFHFKMSVCVNKSLIDSGVVSIEENEDPVARFLGGFK